MKYKCNPCSLVQKFIMSWDGQLEDLRMVTYSVFQCPTCGTVRCEVTEWITEKTLAVYETGERVFDVSG